MSYSTHIVVPSQLSPVERADLIDEMYATHCRIFDGVCRDKFAAYVVESSASRTRIQLLRDGWGRLRGYAAFHVFHEEHEGRRTAIVRMEVGAERAWRRRTVFARFVLSELFRVCLGNPLTPIYLLACFVHPSAFVSVARHAPEMWPMVDRPVPGHIDALFARMARMFSLEPAGGPGVYSVGWITRETTRPAQVSREAAFYVERNPGYVNGTGLLSIVPVSLRMLCQAGVTVALQQLRRSFGFGQRRPATPAALEG